MPPLPPDNRPALSAADRRRDRLWRHFYWLAYRVLRCFWWIFRPKSRGTLVAIWHGEQLLLVKNGYRRHYFLPGGNCGSGESARRAAVREIREEIGLRVFPNQLRYRGTVVSQRDYLRDHCSYFDLHLDTPPPIAIDGREVVAAVWAGPHEREHFPLAHQVRAYLDRYGP